jgi:hypothetical protein
MLLDICSSLAISLEHILTGRCNHLQLLLCYALCYISVPRVDLSQPLTLSVRPDHLTAVYRTHFGRCRYLDT